VLVREAGGPIQYAIGLSPWERGMTKAFSTAERLSALKTLVTLGRMDLMYADQSTARSANSSAARPVSFD
jgi:hypothetical protein